MNMHGSYYRVSGEAKHHSPTEIHVNKDFFGRSIEWLQPHFGQVSSDINSMYNNTNQYAPPGYPTSYPMYQGYDPTYGYPNNGYQDTQATQPPPPEYVMNNWNQSSYPVAPPQPPAKEEQKCEAVAQEIQHQKSTLTKQREDYVRKALVLRRELEQLRHQKHELSDNADKGELASVMKKNERLQDEINGKLKAILNVIEMLSGIIRDGKKFGDLELELDHQEKLSSRSDSNRDKEYSDKENDKRYSYVYYDSGLHWCRACDEFPETAKEYLQHLQGKDHQDMAKENEVDVTPWHKLPPEPILPSYDDAPKKRLPIKGLQFFVSAPSWYCKLCDVWIGDLHCASHHLKSQVHFQNYQNFVEQNPHWETEWFKDREKAMARNGKHDSSDSGGNRKKKRKNRSSIESLLKEKKKKKRSKKKKRLSSDSSSSSSSSGSSSEDETSDRSKSIRVAMRNVSQVKSILNEDISKRAVLEKLLEDHRKKEAKSTDTQDELINQWMTVTESVKEKNILDTLKDRMKAKQEIEKAKYAEIERRKKEKERQEQELQEKKQRQLKEEVERFEKEKLKKSQEELQRIVDKDRGQVKFRASRDHYRGRKSSEREVEAKKMKTSKEPSPRHHKEYESRSKARSPESRSSYDSKRKSSSSSYKKLPFIGRMPLFKKKPDSRSDREEKEIKKEEYEPQRKTRFETGNLAKAFIPRPDVVCFPVLSSLPPMSAPPPPPPPPILPEVLSSPPRQSEKRAVPKAPVVSDGPPSPPEIAEEDMYLKPDFDHEAMGEYYESFNNMMYQTQQYEYQEDHEPLPHPPLEPPPLPPDDDLALLGISADDIGAQKF